MKIFPGSCCLIRRVSLWKGNPGGDKRCKVIIFLSLRESSAPVGNHKIIKSKRAAAAAKEQEEGGCERGSSVGKNNVITIICSDRGEVLFVLWCLYTSEQYCSPYWSFGKPSSTTSNLSRRRWTLPHLPWKESLSRGFYIQCVDFLSSSLTAQLGHAGSAERCDLEYET